jgi:hypothetical protein
VKSEHPHKDPNAAQGKELAPREQPIYRIRVKGHLGDGRADWFEGLTISQEEEGITVMVGPIADQAALYGLLVKLRNLCLPLISVNRVAVPSGGSTQIAQKQQRSESGRDKASSPLDKRRILGYNLI